MALTVNALARTKPSNWPFGDYVVADLTVANTRAGSGLSGLRDAFELVPDGAPPPQGPAALSPDRRSDRLLLGIDKDWQVYDGTRRRGLLVFAVPHAWAGRALHLRSTLFSTLQQPVAKAAYPQPGLLVDRVDADAGDRFQRELAVALKATIARHRAELAAQRPAGRAPADGPAQDVPVPPLTLAGAENCNRPAPWPTCRPCCAACAGCPRRTPTGNTARRRSRYWSRAGATRATWRSWPVACWHGWATRPRCAS